MYMHGYTCAVAPAWRSEDNFRCHTLPFTVFKARCFIHHYILVCQAIQPVSLLTEILLVWPSIPLQSCWNYRHVEIREQLVGVSSLVRSQTLNSRQSSLQGNIFSWRAIFPALFYFSVTKNFRLHLSFLWGYFNFKKIVIFSLFILFPFCGMKYFL